MTSKQKIITEIRLLDALASDLETVACDRSRARAERLEARKKAAEADARINDLREQLLAISKAERWAAVEARGGEW